MAARKSLVCASEQRAHSENRRNVGEAIALNPTVLHIASDHRQQLSELIADAAGLSPSACLDLIAFGAVYVDRQRRLEDGPIDKKAVVRIHLKPKRFCFSLDESNLIYEDDDMVVVDKPPGAPVHATLDNWRENILYRLRHELGRSAFPTHRLDVPTEGLLIFAKSTKAQTEINRLFHDHKVRKVYRVATEMEIPAGEYVHYMDMSTPKPPRPLSAQMQSGWSVCRLEVLKSWSLLWEDTKCLFGSEILLKTGRTHQIRAQLAALKAPIWGDALYGSPKKYVPERIALECLSISFTVRSRTIGLYRPTPLVAPQPTKDFAVDPET